MKQEELTKTFMIISNREKHMVSMVYAKISLNRRSALYSLFFHFLLAHEIPVF